MTACSGGRLVLYPEWTCSTRSLDYSPDCCWCSSGVKPPAFPVLDCQNFAEIPWEMSEAGREGNLFKKLRLTLGTLDNLLYY